MRPVLLRATAFGCPAAAAAWLVTYAVQAVTGISDSDPPICTNVLGSVVSCEPGAAPALLALGVAAAVFAATVAAAFLVGRLRRSATTR
jgi:hypothetical protein